MSGSEPLMPRPSRQPPSVDFIHHHLPQHHKAFSGLMVHYDSSLGRYVPSNQALTTAAVNMSAQTALDSHPDAVSPSHSTSQDLGKPSHGTIPLRPTWTSIGSMSLWNEIFQEAMNQFKDATTEPKDRCKSQTSIRAEGDWESVCTKLEEARRRYQGDGGRSEWFRKKRRDAADQAPLVAEVVGTAAKVLPDSMFSSPILGAVQVILNAVKKGAEVRKQLSDSLDDLIPIFSDVELYLSTFRGDEHIRKAAVDLAVAVLEAVERAIGFFTSKEFVRGLKAFGGGLGGSYEKDLVQSLESINKTVQRLMQEAAKSNMFEGRMYSQETMRMLQQAADAQQKSLEVQKQMSTEQAKGISMLTDVKTLLDHHLKERDRETVVKEFAIERERHRQELEYLRVDIISLRSVSPGLGNPWGPYMPPPPQPSQPVLDWPVTQDDLRQILSSGDIDLVDASFAASRTPDFPSRERAQAQQIVGNHLFRAWMMSPRSAKFLIHWDRNPPRQVANLSPLSLFCVSMAEMLYGHRRFIPLLWLCGRHVSLGDRFSGGRSMLASLADQLLRQHEFDVRSVMTTGAVDLGRLQAGDEKEILRLLYVLICHIPEAITPVFLVDNVILYEREEMEADLALSSLLRLVVDGNLRAAVKVLFTSTPGTRHVRGAFDDDNLNLILEVDTLPKMAWSPSDERVSRELGKTIAKE
ncbi:hypothetical protein CTA2_1862 [Colletotrichum tanaceti]|uniref:Fungal STAND N-terminal Goodbye domain-containing protein n=1 Tax=Colletotrichum tanaceti TaxID=1306861 RepID=A0A4U6XKC3_9PEZI|nr:hypothetical protein CTA2_1862 [Colletotrichum tanaceti]TKW56132.1 hypothetical protein CTA1_3007 [Colletotrichum tanaceti]